MAGDVGRSFPGFPALGHDLPDIATPSSMAPVFGVLGCALFFAMDGAHALGGALVFFVRPQSQLGITSKGTR